MRKLCATVLTVAGAVLLLGACSSDADVALENNRVAAEQFEIQRRIVFINGVTDTYLLEIQGRCSFEDEGVKIEVVCKTGEDEDGRALILRHSMGLSDNVTYVVEQLDPNPVDVYHYRAVFKPETLAPYIDIETSADIEGDGR